MGTHNLCFGSEIRKVYPCKPQFYYMKVGFKGVYITWICFRDINTIHVLFCNLEG